MLQVVEEVHGKRKGWIIVLSVVAAILIVIGILTAMALNDPGRNSAPVPASTGSMFTKLGAAALSGEPAQITQDELNGLLTSRFGSMPPQCIIKEDKTLDVYVPVNYKGIRIGVTANVAMKFNPSRQQLSMQLNSVSVGRLPISPALALRLAKNRLPSGFSAEENVIYADVSTLVGNDMSNATGVDITGMDIFDGKLVITVAGDPDRFRDFVVQSLPELFNFLK